MNDQLPDFEPEQTTEPAAQPPKKRRKPMRRIMTVRPKKQRAVKAEVIRRGRPKGSVNKPKTSAVHKPTIPNGHFRGGAISQPMFNAIIAAHNSLAAFSREEKIIAARALEAMIKSVP